MSEPAQTVAAAQVVGLLGAATDQHQRVIVRDDTGEESSNQITAGADRQPCAAHDAQQT